MRFYPISLNLRVGNVASADLVLGDADKDGRADATFRLQLLKLPSVELGPVNVDAAAVAGAAIEAVSGLWDRMTGKGGAR